MHPLDRLERARSLLDSGRPLSALRLLPRPSALPAPLRAERALLAAEALRGAGLFGPAAPLYRRLLRGRRGDPPLAIEAALGLAALERSLGHARQALGLLRRAARQSRRSGLASAYGERLELEEALAARAAGGYASSARRLQGLALRALARRDGAAAAFCLWGVGGALRSSGRLAGSESAFRRSLALATRAGDAEGRAYALFGLGGITRIRGKLSESAARYAAAGRALARSEDLFGRAYALCGLANALRQLGRLERAERLYRRSRALYARLGDEADLGFVDWGLGQLRLQRGDPRGALGPLEAARAAFARHGEARGEALALLSLAQARHAAGQTALARRLWRRGVSLCRGHGLTAHLERYT